MDSGDGYGRAIVSGDANRFRVDVTIPLKIFIAVPYDGTTTRTPREEPSQPKPPALADESVELAVKEVDRAKNVGASLGQAQTRADGHAIRANAAPTPLSGASEEYEIPSFYLFYFQLRDHLRTNEESPSRGTHIFYRKASLLIHG